MNEDTSLEEIDRAFSVVVRRASLHRLHERINGEAGVSLDRGASPVLSRLSESGPVRITELAAALGLDLSTVSRQVAQLENVGLVERAPDPSDGRASRVGISPEGTRVLGEVRLARRSMLEEMLADWSVEDRAALGRLLGLFAEALANYTESTPPAKPTLGSGERSIVDRAG